jgi:anti-anti-sigma regulatory factor
VVFSIFSRKDKTDPQKRQAEPLRTKAAVMPPPSVAKPQSKDPLQRSAAIQTMAQIDAIESEMNLKAPDPSAPKVARQTPSLHVSAPSQQRAAAAELSAASAPLDFGTSAILGDTAGAGNLEILGSGYAPVVEEAAILFSNGQANEAASLLQSAISDNNLGQATQTVWMMLFDVYQALLKQEEFDNLSIDFAARFESSPPGWRGPKVDANAPKLNPNSSLVVMPVNIDGNVSKQIEQIQSATAKGRAALLEFSKTKSIDAYGAELLLKTLNAFKKAKRELSLTPVENLVNVCRASVEPGRRDTADSIWLLLLEGLRLLEQQQQFEDASIDYCVTFEVSPPSWEPMPPWIRAEAKGPNTVNSSEKLGSRAENDVFYLVGDINGSIATESALLTDYASSRRDVKIDCSDLRRIEFIAAGQLQNQLTTLRTLGKSVTLINVSIPVGTLFGVVGLSDVANIHLRQH